jgi:hypothetical protein
MADGSWNGKVGHTPGVLNCSYCGGNGEVTGVVDDVEFRFRCPCSGGSEVAVRWLLGLDREAPPGEDWVI